MAEAIRVTKPGGVNMAAYCIADGFYSEYTALGEHDIAPSSSAPEAAESQRFRVPELSRRMYL